MKTGLILRRLLLILHLALTALLYAQTANYRIEHLTVRDGLSHGCVRDLLQDSRGFIWIATENGLNRYDGYTIREYLHDPENPHSISSNSIWVIYEDPADSSKFLWIGTNRGGLNKFNLETEQFIHYQHDAGDAASLSDNNITCISKSSSGHYLVGTVGGGLNVLDPESGVFKSYQHDPNNAGSLSDNYVRSICEDHLGHIWIGTDKGLNRLVPADSASGGLSIGGWKDAQHTRFIRYESRAADRDSTHLPSNRIFYVYEDRQHMLWIGGGINGGLRTYNRQNDSFQRHRFTGGYSFELDYGIIFFITEDASGNLWVAMFNDSHPETDNCRNYRGW